MATTRHTLEQLSRELLRDFLLLERIGYELPRWIVLCGGSGGVMRQLARAIKKEIAGCRRKISVRTERRRNPASAGDGRYYIDVGYFEGKKAL